MQLAVRIRADDLGYTANRLLLGGTMLASVLTVLATAAFAGGPPDLIAIEVDLVRVTPTRPGTNQPWALPGRPAQDNSCALFSTAVTAAGVASGGVGLLAGPAVKSLFCSDPGAAGQAHSVTDPNIYVRLSSGRMAFRSYTVAKTRSHSFKFRVLVPVAAIPRAGLVLDVVDDDGSGDGESQETIGHVRLSADKLIEAAKSEAPIELKDGGIEKLELIASVVEPNPRTKSQTLNVQKGLAALDNFSVSAGEVVEIQARGAYRVSGRSDADLVTAKGFPGAGVTYPDEPFKNGPLGAGLVRIGQRGVMKGYLVTPCASFISPFEGQIAVGINNGHPETARGDLQFDVRVRPASESEWKAGAADACVPAAEVSSNAPSGDTAVLANKAATRLKAFGDKFAVDIIKRLHPTGGNATLGNVEVKPSAAGVVALITTEWRGGLLGTAYTSTIRWEFSPARHVGSFLVSDTAASLLLRMRGEHWTTSCDRRSIRWS